MGCPFRPMPPTRRAHWPTGRWPKNCCTATRRRHPCRARRPTACQPARTKSLMSAKRGIGRGLVALIPTAEGNPTSLPQLPVSASARNARQPRARLNPTVLEELAISIREHGVIQPIIVAQSPFPCQYPLIAGERRLEASKLAGLRAVPAIVREATEQQLLEV